MAVREELIDAPRRFQPVSRPQGPKQGIHYSAAHPFLETAMGEDGGTRTSAEGRIVRS
jgi:hypothetical protein